MSEALRVCRRCLLTEDDSQAELAKTVQEYVALIPADQRAAEGEYQKRLAACKACDQLISGMCRACGCFVEARAAKARMHCPDVNGKW